MDGDSEFVTGSLAKEKMHKIPHGWWCWICDGKPSKRKGSPMILGFFWKWWHKNKRNNPSNERSIHQHHAFHLELHSLKNISMERWKLPHPSDSLLLSFHSLQPLTQKTPASNEVLLHEDLFFLGRKNRKKQFQPTKKTSNSNDIQTPKSSGDFPNPNRWPPVWTVRVRPWERFASHRTC